MVRQLQALEESESVTVSCYSLLHLVRQLQEEQQDWSSSLMIGHNASLVWFLARGTANTCPDTDLAQALGQQAEAEGACEARAQLRRHCTVSREGWLRDVTYYFKIDRPCKYAIIQVMSNERRE